MRLRVGALSLAAAVSLALAGCGGIQERTPAASSTTSTNPLPEATGDQCAAVAGEDLEALEDKPLTEAIAAMPGVTAYAGYLAANESRAAQLDGATKLTMFVPADSAYTTIDPDTAAKLADPAWQLALVEYSAVVQLVVPDELASGEMTAMPTLRGPEVTMSAVTIGEQIKINGLAGVLCGSVAFSGGLIYVIDTVLLPAA